MNAASYDRVKEIFAAASGCAGGARGSVLDRECGDDAPLRREVESLLDHDTDPRIDLDQGALDMSHLVAAETDGHDVVAAHFQTLGPYQILSPLGEGGMGQVFLAQQKKPQRMVALKIVRAGLPSASMLRRFEHEIEVLGRLQHEGIAQIYEAGVAETEHGVRHPYIAMEHVRGLPLIAYADAHALDSAERLRLIARIARAVQHAHHRGVIHRDLKPANVLVDDAGQVKILDFGIARCIDPGPGNGHGDHTRTGQILGTLAYMSPEQVAGAPGGVDTRSDVYAIGVLAYELLSGRLPVDVTGKPLPEAARLIADHDTTSLASIRREFRGDVETIIGKAMDKDTSRRYQSAADLAADIDRFLAGAPIDARRDSVAYVLGRRLKRYKGVVTAAAVLVVALSAFAVYAGVQAERQGALADRSRAYAGFLNRMLLSAGPESARGRDISVLREMLDDFAQRSRLELEDLQDVQVDVQHTLGNIYLSLGLFEEAQPLLESVVTLRRRMLGDDHPDLARALGSLGDVQRARARRAEAERSYREALAIQLASGDDPGAAAISLTNLAELFTEMPGGESTDEAGQLIRRALAIYDEVPPADEGDRLFALAVYGQILDQEGDVDGAIEVLRESLRIRRARDGDGSLSVATGLAQLGRALRHHGDDAEAEACLRDALDIRREMLDDYHTARAWPAIQLALVLVEREAFEEAEALCREGLGVYGAALGTENRQYHEAQADLAFVLGASGQLAAARDRYGQVIAWMTEHVGPADPLVKMCREQLAAISDSAAGSDRADR